jgi:hypothetical protein
MPVRRLTQALPHRSHRSDPGEAAFSKARRSRRHGLDWQIVVVRDRSGRWSAQ